MKRRATFVFDPKDVTYSYDNALTGERIMTVTGEFSFSLDSLQRFVDVQLLDAGRISLNQPGMTWTYEDDLDAANPLRVGDYVLVPFGWSDGEYLAKVVAAGPLPTYTGDAPIKQVAARMVSEV